MAHNISIAELSASVVTAAAASRARIITAESCTAGSLTTLLADTPGAGDVLLGGLITFAKACKTELLATPPEILETSSAVSEEVAKAMVKGALEGCASASIAVATTCVGGPEPDEDGNPVGLAYIAVQRRGNVAVVRQFSFEGDTPGRIRGEVLRQALLMLLEALPA